MIDSTKYIIMSAMGCIPASMANGQTVYESKAGRTLTIYTPSTIPKRLREMGCCRGIPYRAVGQYGTIYGWLPPDYPLRPIGPKTEEFDNLDEIVEEVENA